MAEEFNIILEHLRSIRSDIVDLKTGQRAMQEDLLTIKHHMAGFMSHEARQDEEIAIIRSRLERIESRLSLVDEDRH